MFSAGSATSSALSDWFTVSGSRTRKRFPLQHRLIHRTITYMHKPAGNAPVRLICGRQHFSQNVMVSGGISRMGKTRVVFIKLTCGPQTAQNWTLSIMLFGVPFNRWCIAVDDSLQLSSSSEQLSLTGANCCNFHWSRHWSAVSLDRVHRPAARRTHWTYYMKTVENYDCI